MEVTPHKIRPAARLLRTVGQDLIKDVYAAIVELVKNSYDADSDSVVIGFLYSKEKNQLIIDVIDKGHGMSYDTVVNKWLVPATNDKLKRKRSEKNRVLQGRKGIGRFAALTLGKKVVLETVKDNYLTKLELDMEEVDSLHYLDELMIDVSHSRVNQDSGTSIKLVTNNLSEDDVKKIWTPKQFRKLLVELRSLTAPQEVHEAAKKQGFKIEYDNFDVKLKFDDFPVEDFSNRIVAVEPFPVLDLFDYRVFGSVSKEGVASIAYENQNIPSLKRENIVLNIPVSSDDGQAYPGEFFIDLRVYDRDSDSINNMIERGLKDPETGDFVGKREARDILDEYYGVGIYREQFKIRPYGDQEFDWLDLDKKRVQDPSRKIGHNQVIGFVNIRHEESSGLEEKSARDGLIENRAYFGLVTIISTIIRQLEVRRFRYREKALKGGRSNTVENEIGSLFSLERAREDIEIELKKLEDDPNLLTSVTNSISDILKKEQDEKSTLERKVRETIAVYQGQATLGKITHVLLHEGRKHIKYITETSPRIVKWLSKAIETSDTAAAIKVQGRSEKIVTHANGLSFLFKKIEPLARTKRSPNKEIDINKELLSIGSIFHSDLKDNSISFDVRNYSSVNKVNCNEVDFITVFSNLIENSIFWMTQKADCSREILVNIYGSQEFIEFEYSDTGPGFQGDNLDLMFEPGYSMKPDGTGLGLALAGEAIARIGGDIEAKHSPNGAFFIISIKGSQ